MQNTEVKCPKCGASFLIPEHEAPMCGVAIGKDSGMGTVFLKTCDEPTVQRGPDGKFMKKNKSLADDVLSQGHVKNHRLYRRWIMSQMFHMLDNQNCGQMSRGFTEQLRGMGWQYMWRVIHNETHDMTTIYNNGDIEEFSRRWRWWNVKQMRIIVENAVKNVKLSISCVKMSKRRGRKYIPGSGFLTTEAIESTLKELDRCVTRVRESEMALRHITDSVSNHGMGSILSEYDKLVYEISNRMRAAFHPTKLFPLSMSSAFIDSYKGNGAYYTLRNMLMFHGCVLPHKFFSEPYASRANSEEKGVKKQLNALERIAHMYEYEGWRLLGVLKEVIAFNGINIRKKIESWR